MVGPAPLWMNSRGEEKGTEREFGALLVSPFSMTKFASVLSGLRIVDTPSQNIL